MGGRDRCRCLLRVPVGDPTITHLIPIVVPAVVDACDLAVPGHLMHKIPFAAFPVDSFHINSAHVRPYQIPNFLADMPVQDGRTFPIP